MLCWCIVRKLTGQLLNPSAPGPPCQVSWPFTLLQFVHVIFLFMFYLTVWGVEPVVTHQTSWLESTGVMSSWAPSWARFDTLRCHTREHLYGWFLN